jgi:hypothetical protein
MVRRKIVPVSSPSAPYMKSPLQLEQWAAYEEITARRAQEVAQVKKTKFDASTLMSQASNWKTAEAIRTFVAATVANVPDSADESAQEAAKQWQTWALGVADDLDQSKQVAASFTASQSLAR